MIESSECLRKCNFQNGLIASEYQSCSSCLTPIYCPNVVPTVNSYFLCTKCMQSMAIQENICSLSTQINRLNQRVSKKKICSFENSINESLKNTKKNKELIDRFSDTLDDSFSKLSKKYDFKFRIRNLEVLFLGQKIFKLIMEKNNIIDHFHKNSNRVKLTRIKLKEINTLVDSLNITVKKLDQDVNDMKSIPEQIIPTMEDQTLYIKDTFEKLSNRLTTLENDIEETRPKSKDYKELRKLRHDLTLKDGEYNKFKKSMAKFNFKISILYLIIGFNSITIFGLLAYIFM